MREARASEEDRGVFLAPWLGENGELVLIARTSRRTRAAEREIPIGASHHAVADELWAILDRVDPDRRRVMKVI